MQGSKANEPAIEPASELARCIDSSSDEPDRACAINMDADALGYSDWEQVFRDKLPAVSWESDKLNIGTVCSGTDAPVHGLQRVYGWRHVRQIFSCDSATSAAVFIAASFACEHVYNDAADLLEFAADTTSVAKASHTQPIVRLSCTCSSAAFHARRSASGICDGA